jgi:hypothetical protein
LLSQVFRGCDIPQVTQTIKVNARSHATKQFGLRCAVGGADPTHEFSVAQFNFHQHIFHV